MHTPAERPLATQCLVSRAILVPSAFGIRVKLYSNFPLPKEEYP
jgi:hypothetical protein